MMKKDGKEIKKSVWVDIIIMTKTTRNNNNGKMMGD